MFQLTEQYLPQPRIAAEITDETQNAKFADLFKLSKHFSEKD